MFQMSESTLGRCCSEAKLKGPKTLNSSDEPELEFSGSSRAELGKLRAKPSQAGAL